MNNFTQKYSEKEIDFIKEKSRAYKYAIKKIDTLDTLDIEFKESKGAFTMFCNGVTCQPSCSDCEKMFYNLIKENIKTVDLI